MVKRSARRRNVGQQVIVGGVKTANGEAHFSGSSRPGASIPVKLVVAGSTGTSPTLNVVVEQSVDGQTWTNKLTFAQRTGAGSETLQLTQPHQDRLKVRWTIGGTGSPSFDFSVFLDFDAMVK
jgi:hypothetical protein